MRYSLRQKINSGSLEQDAYLRTADCYYMNRDYKRAEAMYDKVLGFSWPSSDYATFQKAMIAGVGSGKRRLIYCLPCRGNIRPLLYAPMQIWKLPPRI